MGKNQITRYFLYKEIKFKNELKNDQRKKQMYVLMVVPNLHCYLSERKFTNYQSEILPM